MGATKGVEVVNYLQKFVDAVKGIPGADVFSQPSWELYNMSPEDFSKQLECANIIVIGDVDKSADASS